jgi:hypothetical protein
MTTGTTTRSNFNNERDILSDNSLGLTWVSIRTAERPEPIITGVILPGECPKLENQISRYRSRRDS